MGDERVEIIVVSGVEGPSLYVNGYRVLGNKPWGGGDTLQSWKVDSKTFKEDILEALDCKP